MTNNSTLWDQPTHVYQVIDEQGGTLYVGITCDIKQRMSQHKRESSWWQKHATITYDTYPSRREAMAAESLIIETLNPPYNIVGTVRFSESMKASHLRRRRFANTSEEVVTIGQAAERYDVSTVTLRRRLLGGEVVNAYKRPSRSGEEWVIPVSSLAALGYNERRVNATTETSVSPMIVPGVVTDFEAIVERLNSIATRKQEQSEDSSTDLIDTQIKAAVLGSRLEMTVAELERERARADALADELSKVHKQHSQAHQRGFFIRRQKVRP